jgi:hypothetical protein
VIPVDEETGQSVVGMDNNVRFPLLTVGDSRQLLRTAVLTPTNCIISVEDESGMCLAFADQSLLEGAVAFEALPPLWRPGVEGQAPAATPHTIVLLHESGECIEGLNSERLDRVFSHDRDRK